MPSTTSNTSESSPSQAARPERAKVLRAIRKRSFATLATTSPAHRPHVAGVLYEAVDGVLYVNTKRTSRKARNIVANPNVAVAIPVRRLPIGPPSSIQFQGTATLLDLDDPEILELVAAGRLKSITGHGELEIEDGCFLRVTPNKRLFTYGLGMSLYRLIKDPLNVGGVIDLPDEPR